MYSVIKVIGFMLGWYFLCTLGIIWLGKKLKVDWRIAIIFSLVLIIVILTFLILMPILA